MVDDTNKDDWHHAVLILNGTKEVEAGALKAYLDGKLIGTDKGSQLWQHGGDIGIGAVNGDTKFVFGDCDKDTGFYFGGIIDEFRIYNKALNEDKIEKLYKERR